MTSDQVIVAGVPAMILCEKGEAIKSKGDWWEYVLAAEGRVVVDARDLAGNVVKEEL